MHPRMRTAAQPAVYKQIQIRKEGNNSGSVMRESGKKELIRDQWCTSATTWFCVGLCVRHGVAPGGIYIIHDIIWDCLCFDWAKSTQQLHHITPFQGYEFQHHTYRIPMKQLALPVLGNLCNLFFYISFSKDKSSIPSNCERRSEVLSIYIVLYP